MLSTFLKLTAMILASVESSAASASKTEELNAVEQAILKDTNAELSPLRPARPDVRSGAGRDGPAAYGVDDEQPQPTAFVDRRGRKHCLGAAFGRRGDVVLDEFVGTSGEHLERQLSANRHSGLYCLGWKLLLVPTVPAISLVSRDR